MIIHKDSWHYMLNRKLDGYIEDDSCKYIRSTTINLIICAFLFAICMLFVSVLVVIPLSAAAAMLVVGYWWLDEMFVLPLLVIGIGIGIMILYIICDHIHKKRERDYYAQWDSDGNYIEQVHAEPTFFSQVHDRIKNKFCTKVELV